MSRVIDENTDEIITEISMSHIFKSWLVLEGESDEKLLTPTIISTKAKSIVANGWDNVVTIVTSCKTFSGKKVIGLIDRDYRDWNNTQVSDECIVLTDYRDIENILFESSAFKKVIVEYGSKSKLPKYPDHRIKFDEIKQEINNASLFIGRLRAFCFINNTGICFNRLDHIKFIDDRTLEIDEKKLVNHLRGHKDNSSNMALFDINQIKSDWIPSTFNNSYFIRNGHDIMDILVIAFKRKWGSHGSSLKRENIESSFRLGIEKQEIENTDFFQQLYLKL